VCVCVSDAKAAAPVVLLCVQQRKNVMFFDNISSGTGASEAFFCALSAGGNIICADAIFRSFMDII